VKRLPAQLPACVLVVMHSPPNGSGALADILGRSTSLPVAFGKTGDPVEPGHIYVARPDFHLLVTPSGLRVAHGPRENGFRPAIDPLFRSAARELGPRVIGVVLSGALGDGAYGLSTIKQHGGIAIAQSPEDAIVPSMPLTAIKNVNLDHILTARDIGATIDRLKKGACSGINVMSVISTLPRASRKVNSTRSTARCGVRSGCWRSTPS
jgi:two-component system chemotaxis response regulator CheB